MKNAFLFIVLLGLFASVAGAEQSDVQFRNMEWGSHVDSIYKNGERVNFVETENSRSSNAYKIPNDDMSIGTVRLNSLHYLFNEDKRLTQVHMEADIDDSPDMRFILRHRFGEPSEVREMVRVKIQHWDLGDLHISLSEYPDQDIFTVTFASRWEQSESYRININVDDF